MDMDPIAAAALVDVVGGAAKELVEKTWHLAERLIEERFRHTLPEAQRAALENSAEFVRQLAERVARIEEEAEDRQEARQRIIRALEDPDVAVLLNDAVLISSRTDNKDRQSILARIVAERLHHENDDLLSRVSALACETVDHITSQQLRILGLVELVLHIRPDFRPTDTPEGLGPLYSAWLTSSLAYYLPIERPREVDLVHLDALSCIRYSSKQQAAVLWDASHTLDGVLAAGSPESWSYGDWAQVSPVADALQGAWDSWLDGVSITTTGRLIGRYVYEERSKQMTPLGW
jgi:hypothetical protein